jgi:hypothetical protein
MQQLRRGRRVRPNFVEGSSKNKRRHYETERRQQVLYRYL